MAVIVMALANLAFLIYLLVRNVWVCNERLRVTNEIHRLSLIDIRHGREWEWRYEAFNQISYERMMYQFWRPVSRFYDNHECLTTT